MLMELVGQEWSRTLPLRTKMPDQATTRWVNASLTAGPGQMEELANEALEQRFSLHLPALLQRGRDAVAAGRRDVSAIGRALVAFDYTGGEGAAAGHFLIGYSLGLHPDAKRSFELARRCYRDAAAPHADLPTIDLGDGAAVGVRERLSALAATACDSDLLFGKASIQGLITAWMDLALVDGSCAARLETGLRIYREALKVVHEVIAGRGLPKKLPSLESEETIDLLSVAMVAVDHNPTVVVELARSLDRAHRAAGRSAVELDQVVHVLVSTRSWDTAATVLQDMVSHGDPRTRTLQTLATALTETDRWHEAKALLEAHIGNPPQEADVPLMQDLVMLGIRRGDPSVGRWSSALDAMGHSLPQGAMPPPTTLQSIIESTPELLARFENGRLTMDPRLFQQGEAAIEPHMIAAMIIGLGDGSEKLRRETRERDPELYEQVNRLLPPSHRERAPEEVHFDKAEDLFSKGRYREAIEEYKEAIRCKPDFAVAHLYLGDAHFMLGEYHLAAAHFTESIAIEPTPQAYRFLGDAMQRTGRELSLVKQCYEQALALDPNYGGAIVALEQLNGLTGP